MNFKNWIYVADCGDGIRKVGTSINPERRMVALRQEHRMQFILERTWHRPLFDGRDIEHKIHTRLKPLRFDGPMVHREFYTASLEQIIEAVEAVIDADAARAPRSRRLG